MGVNHGMVGDFFCESFRWVSWCWLGLTSQVVYVWWIDLVLGWDIPSKNPNRIWRFDGGPAGHEF